MKPRRRPTGQALQLLAVVVRSRLLDLRPDLLDAPFDVRLLAGAVDDGRIVLVDDRALAAPEVLQGDVLELEPELLGDHAAAGENRDGLEHGLAAVAEARRLHRRGVQRAADLVDHQSRQRLALDILGDEQ